MKALTILIPVYNTEKYIKRCLDSLIVSEIMDDIEMTEEKIIPLKLFKSMWIVIRRQSD